MTTSTTATTAVPLFWFTDRTRFRLGTARCPRARYLSNHAGPTGGGLTHRSDSLPMITGIYVHRGLEGFTQLLKTHDRLPSLGETREIIRAEQQAYTTRCTERGFRDVLGGPDTEETITEQSVLISGLLWILRLKFLPWLHQSYRVVAVEEEHLHFLDCRCGASPFDVEEHIRRGCGAKAIMQRTDLLAQRRNGSMLASIDCKTIGSDSPTRYEEWEIDPQLALSTVDATERWGAEVSELYIVGLNKGRRQKDRYLNTTDERKKQQTSLCYGQLRPGNPPLAPDDWLPAYEWVNEAGELKRASRAHRKAGVWTLADSDWPDWLRFREANPGVSAEEFWVRMLPDSVIDKVCTILGPMNRLDQQLEMLLRSFAAEEERWQQTAWALYELQAAGHAWSSDTFQQALDAYAPCSWNCRPYGRDHQCEFVPICYRHQGWADPIGSGQYQPRLPHHEPELRQAVARGLLPAEAAAVDEEE